MWFKLLYRVKKRKKKKKERNNILGNVRGILYIVIVIITHNLVIITPKIKCYSICAKQQKVYD